ncbi:PAS domain-containing protein [Paucibacter sp. APW11]|uniref:histidine kinase n=1 Tax=Roseateles aquae TaxID=3077235 RepID=A0ABU3PD01_9BURK|nr:PAS domain-containing protein [Paucibacter sp. APW11]MDT9000013.1 PAS domain-containing protein [Paucibacter sp. APW11]
MSNSSVEGAGLAQAALQALMCNDLPIGLAVLDHELRYLQINEMLARANGLSVQEHLGRTVREVLPDAADSIEPLLQRVLNGGEALRNLQIEAEVPSLPGELSAWEASYLPLRGTAGHTEGILVQAINRSLERGLQRQQEASETYLRRVLDSLFVFVGVLDTEGRLLEANRAPLEAGDVELEQVRGRYVWDTPWWSHDVAEQAWLRDAVRQAAEGQVLRRDLVVRMAGDSRMAVDFMLAPLRDDAGRITHLIPSGMDISARRASELALQDSEARYRRMFEGSTVGKALIDGEGHIVLANASLAALFGYQAEAMVGLSVHALVPAAQRGHHAEQLQRYMQAPTLRYMAQRQALCALRRDGSEFPVEIALNPMPGGQQVLMTLVDVTERRAAMEQIERALVEKTVLLNELHHRVKNNLQVICSLLSLQAAHAEPAVRLALRDSQARVRAMALLHQLLFERADLSALELGPYLQRLGSLLRETNLDAAAVQLIVEAPMSGLSVTMAQAVPCGLLVNELITNALKHAFPGGRRGQVVVRAWAEDGGVAVEVRDDGIGLPAGVGLGDGGGGGLGFQLLPLLAEQCQGRLSLQGQPGTRVCLQIPLSLSV